LAKYEWVKEFPGAITVCNSKGIILEMNEKALASFQAQGGKKLIGTNLVKCHPEPARRKLSKLMRRRQANVYTVEKGGVRKLIYQSPWYSRGKYRGFVQISLKIPGKIPHFIRDA